MKKKKKTLLRLFSSSRPWTTPPPPPPPTQKFWIGACDTGFNPFVTGPTLSYKKSKMTEISLKRQMFRAPLFFNHICVIHQSLVTMAQATEQGGE